MNLKNLNKKKEMTLYSIMSRIPSSNIHPKIIKMINDCPIIKYIKYDSMKKTYIINPSDIPDSTTVKYITQAVRTKGNPIKFGGLTRKLKMVWYPTYNYKVEKCVSSDASSITKGSRIHDEMFKYLQNPKIKVKNLDEYTRAILVWLTKKREMPQISELPCIGKSKHYATQADLIVQNIDTKKLILYEIKTGQLSSNNDGYFKKPLDKIKNNRINQAYLQLFYTKSAIELTTPLRVDECYVLNVFKMKKKEKVSVRRVLPVPPWFKYLLKNKANQTVLLNQLKYRDKNSDFNRYRNKRKRTGHSKKPSKKKKK